MNRKLSPPELMAMMMSDRSAIKSDSEFAKTTPTDTSYAITPKHAPMATNINNRTVVVETIKFGNRRQSDTFGSHNLLIGFCFFCKCAKRDKN